MPHALSDLRTELAKLREQNAKLVSDNTTLSRITAQQHEQLKQRAADGNNGHIVQGLQHQIQQLKGDRDMLMNTQQQ